jgi:hypothetical protein
VVNGADVHVLDVSGLATVAALDADDGDDLGGVVPP